MARLARLYAPGVVQHVTQHGSDGRAIFSDAADYLAFIAILHEAARAHGLAMHAYVLMPGHVHLLATPLDADSIARVMQAVGRRYVPYFNRKSQRGGALWEGRYRSTLIDATEYLLTCTRYLETKPVAQGLAGSPGDYPWSSFAHHAGIANNPLVTDHALYWALGNTPFERQAAYRALFAKALDASVVTRIDDATEHGWALGNADFVAGLAAAANRRVRPLARGRRGKSEK